jgi:hypothetical protein
MQFKASRRCLKQAKNWNISASDRIGEEFGVKYIVKTSGDEYQRLNEVAKTGYPLIVPVNSPKVMTYATPTMP